MKKLQVKYAEKREPDYVLFEILQALTTARNKIRRLEVPRYEQPVQQILDKLYEELRNM
jgi:hypothetical protein